MQYFFCQLLFYLLFFLFILFYFIFVNFYFIYLLTDYRLTFTRERAMVIETFMEIASLVSIHFLQWVLFKTTPIFNGKFFSQCPTALFSLPACCTLYWYFWGNFYAHDQLLDPRENEKKRKISANMKHWVMVPSI